jgi:hypothetical protein
LSAVPQVTALLDQNSELQQRVDQQRCEHASMLGRMADVTSKWQATVAENARLNAALSAAKAEAAELQQLLMQFQHCQPAYF